MSHKKVIAIGRNDDTPFVNYDSFESVLRRDTQDELCKTHPRLTFEPTSIFNKFDACLDAGKRVAVVLIDPRNIGFNLDRSEFTFGKKEPSVIDVTQITLLEYAQRQGVPTVHCQFGGIDHDEMEKQMREHEAGQRNAFKVPKAFSDSDHFKARDQNRDSFLLRILRTLDVNTVFMMGYNISACVKSTATTALWNQLHVVCSFDTAQTDDPVISDESELSDWPGHWKLQGMCDGQLDPDSGRLLVENSAHLTFLTDHI
jgi:nicotinamidase-related amidase